MRGDQLITSAMTVGEILVKPRERQDLDLCRGYERGDHRNRARSSVRPERSEEILHAAPQIAPCEPPDAIQLSCAATVDTDLFITNDSRLSGLKVDGIQFIVSLDRAPSLIAPSERQIYDPFKIKKWNFLSPASGVYGAPRRCARWFVKFISTLAA